MPRTYEPDPPHYRRRDDFSASLDRSQRRRAAQDARLERHAFYWLVFMVGVCTLIFAVMQ